MAGLQFAGEHELERLERVERLAISAANLQLAQNNVEMYRQYATRVLTDEALRVGLTLESLMQVRVKLLLDTAEKDMAHRSEILRMYRLVMAKGVEDGRIGEADIRQELERLPSDPHRRRHIQ